MLAGAAPGFAFQGGPTSGVTETKLGADVKLRRESICEEKVHQKLKLLAVHVRMLNTFFVTLQPGFNYPS